MTLLLNYRPVLTQPTGIGVYAEAVLPSLQRLPHHFVPGGGRGGASQRLQRLVWTQFQLPRLAQLQRASLIFTPAPEGYLGTQLVPQVVMVHDLRPLSHPGRDLQTLYFHTWVPALLRNCLHIITNSRFTAEEIQRQVRVSPSRISVIPLGIDHHAFTAVAGAPSLSADYAPYLLHVGQAYPHKNLRRLIKVFGRLVKLYPELRLLLVGKSHPSETTCLHNLVDELGLQDRVVFLPYCPSEHLPDLYRRAFALVYPSLWEGFGLPILEAMACGIPVVTSAGSAIEEVAGDAALLVDPLNEEELFSAVNAVIREPRLRDQLSCKGIQRAALFNWRVTAYKTSQLLGGLLETHG
jgi:glycosyltransferase involved in cell wall biosynthesis